MTAVDPIPRTVLFLDPSSTSIGWAAFNTRLGLLDSFGLIGPPKSGMSSLNRIDAMSEALKGLLEDVQPGLVVIEWTGGKIHGQYGRIAGLAVLGQAQGDYRRQVLSFGYKVETVDNNLWTRSKSKAKRAERTVIEYPEFREWAGPWKMVKGKKGGEEIGGLTNDPGMDVADAIGLGSWWLKQQRGGQPERYSPPRKQGRKKRAKRK